MTQNKSILLTAKRGKGVIAVIWLFLFCTALYGWYHSGIPLKKVPARLESWLEQFGMLKAASIYVALFTLRPLTLFPASLLTLAAGLVFGPVYGILFTIVGENASANVAFFLARWFGRDAVAALEGEMALAARWEEKLRRNGLVTVMIMRLLYLPFDVVNAFCGLSSMRPLDFAVGTFIGLLPAIITFVLFGGAAAAGNAHRGLTLVLAFFFLVLGLAVAHLIRRRQDDAESGHA